MKTESKITLYFWLDKEGHIDENRTELGQKYTNQIQNLSNELSQLWYPNYKLPHLANILKINSNSLSNIVGSNKSLKIMDRD